MPRPRQNPVTDAQILTAYEIHRSTHKAADALGIGGTTVGRVLIKHGIERTGLKEYRETKRVNDGTPYIGVYQGSTQEIIDWYASGLSMKEIAKKIGRSVQVVQRRVGKAGINRRWGAGGPDHSMWTGGRLDAGQGYWRIWVADGDPLAAMRNSQGYVLEHRLVMARKLGRQLRRSETVHHIDGDRANNAPENLQLRQGKHGKHVVMVCLDCGSHNVAPAPLVDPVNE